ncbi:hypothetical protein AB0D12_32010 [Streptomyces sp. NPDC048479]|uniref:hypothetical protein n=1 Tax=Streptomyces sp. NPDC048479 TaxID=3154725 RepID=UPI003439D5EF
MADTARGPLAGMDDPAYIAGLATELRIHQPGALELAENDLQRLRAVVTKVAAWIHNPAYDDTARHALAELLGLPAPR